LRIEEAAMKKLLIATVAILVSVAAVDWARAAPVATPWNWTGFYVGGNVGYSWGDWNSTSVAAIFPGSPAFTKTDSPNVQRGGGGRPGQIQLAVCSAMACRYRGRYRLERRTSER
jgi:outer membrane immunogenic protein